jgi:tetratricopeptide (TPR) repeat protein
LQVDRYASASELAADLQAVADGGPLRFAREPVLSRAAGWARRHRLRLAVALPVLVGLVVAVAARFRAQAAGLHRESVARRFFDRGELSLAVDDCAAAAAQFAAAAELTDGWPGLRDLGREALAMQRRAIEAGEVRSEADALGRLSGPLRFHLLGFGGDRASASRDLGAALVPFRVLDEADWSGRPELRLLDGPRRARLLEEVNGLLFSWVVAAVADGPGDEEVGRRGVLMCDRALAFAEPRAPWVALRDWCRWQAGAAPRRPPLPIDPSAESSARACFQWGLLATLAGDRGLALGWLARAQFLRPDDYWNEYALAYHLEQAGDVEGALRHYEAAVALRPGAPWARFNRAHLYAFRRGAWGHALRDLDRAVTADGDLAGDRARFRVERGKVRQAVGDVVGARDDFQAAIASDPAGGGGRDARLDLARLDAEAGAPWRACAAYDALILSDPSDRTARLARALLALRRGRPTEAEADLTYLLNEAQDALPTARADWLEYRALARLVLRHTTGAVADAEAALRLGRTPGRLRLRARASLAANGPVEPALLHPDEIAGWPVGGQALAADLQAAAERLRPAAADPVASSSSKLLALAAILSALGDHAAAAAEADRAVWRSPSAAAYALRAEVRARAGNRPGALADVERGLAIDRASPRLLALRGRFSVEDGDLGAGLAWLDRALRLGAGGTVHQWKAAALMGLGRAEDAASAWSDALAGDPEDPFAYLGRARSMRRLGLWENALADLERAAERAAEGSPLLVRVTLDYLDCVPARPDRLHRVAGLVRRNLLGWFSMKLRP